MPLADQQRLLARLYTDGRLRRRFFTDVAAVAGEFGLSDAHADQCARLAAAQVQSFARSLQRKRLNDVARVLPATRRLLGCRFDELFLHFADAGASERAETIAAEAEAFGRFLRIHARGQGSSAVAAADVARYEAARVRAARVPVLLQFFRFDVGALQRAAARGEPVRRPTLGWTVVIWFRLSPRGPLRHALYSLTGSGRGRE